MSETRAEVGSGTRDRDRAIKRVALLVGLAFLAPVLVLTFTPPSAGGESCGTWINPRFTDIGTSFAKLEVSAAGGDSSSIDAIAAECGDALAGRRTLVLSLLALGLVVRFSIPAIARAVRT